MNRLRVSDKLLNFLLSISVLGLLVACNAEIHGPTGFTQIDFSISSSVTDKISEYNFGIRPVGGTFETDLFVINTGDRPIKSVAYSAPSAPFSYKGGIFPGVGGDCTGNLAANSYCKLVVTFIPTLFSTENSSVTMTYIEDAPGQTAGTRVLPIVGTGSTPAQLTLSDKPTFSFGSIPAGGVISHTFTLTNSGGSQDIHADLERAQKIIKEVIYTSRFAFLKKPVGIVIKECHLSHTIALVLTSKAYVIDVRFEKAFQTDIITRVTAAFNKNKIKRPASLSFANNNPPEAQA